MPVSAGNLAQLASILTANSSTSVPAANTAFMAATAACKPRSFIPTSAGGSNGGPAVDAVNAAAVAAAAAAAAAAAGGLNYSFNDLSVNFQSLQPIEAANTFQVPVGL